MKAKSLQAHNGIHIQHTRGTILRNVFDLQLRVVVSISQSTKHRVTLFHYVVSSLMTPFITINIIVNMLKTSAKVQKDFENDAFQAEKDMIDSFFLG